MNKKKLIIPALALGLLVSSGTAFAFNGTGYMPNISLDGFNQTQKDAIQKSFEIKKTAQEQSQKVLTDGGVSREDMQKARKAQMQIQKDQMDKIFTNGDYQAFLALTQNNPHKKDVTETQFQTMVQAHKLMTAGDKQGAKTLLENAGINQPGFGGKGHDSKMRGVKSAK